MEELNDKTVCADSDLRADMERWHRSKHKDMKEQFMGMADRQIKHYETVSGSLHLYMMETSPCEVYPFKPVHGLI